MKRRWFATALVAAAVASEPALACRVYSPLVPEDVQYAEVVLVGRIAHYRIVRDEAFRERMLSNPNLSPERREIYQGEHSLLSDYARFEVEVEEVLFGSVPERLIVTWDNSTFSEPEQLGPGPFLIALRRPSSTMAPLRGPSATVSPSAEPGLYTLLQAPCSSPFLFENASDEAHVVRRLVASRQP